MADEPPSMKTASWHLASSPYSACPLCGLGEASSQHLCLWCPAVGMAWEHLRGTHATTMIQDIGRDPSAAGPAAALARQIMYLYGSLTTRAAMQWQDA
eukprot:13076407-Heterocapsa_arctica.AAC.1